MNEAKASRYSLGLYSWPVPERMSHSDETSSVTPGRDDERPAAARVVDQQLLEVRVTQCPHGVGERLAEQAGQVFGEPAHDHRRG